MRRAPWHARCSLLRRRKALSLTPTNIEFDGRTALLVVDVQNDFAHPSGNLYVEGAEELVDPINALVGRAVAEGAFVVYTQDYHPQVTPHFREQGGPWPKHCVQGTWGAELVAGLEIAGPILRKGMGGDNGYSGFVVRDQKGVTQPTDLARLLRARRIERVVVCGLAQDVCVKDTALDAARLGFECEVLLEATRPVDEGALESVLDELARGGVTVT